LHALIIWGWDWCLFGNDDRHYKLTLGEGTGLAKSQLRAYPKTKTLAKSN